LKSLSTYGYILEEVTLDLHSEDVNYNVMTEYEKRFVSEGVKICMLKANKKK
jgi:tRNA (guanine-N7-)-methyltransferase